ADAEGEIVGEDALDVLHLARRAPVQVLAPRDQRRAAGGRLHLGRAGGFYHAELYVLDREFGCGAFVEGFQYLRRDLRLRGGAAHREFLAAGRDADVERVLDLAQVLVERATQVGETLVVDRRESDFDGLQTSAGASSPRSECGRAAVMVTSAKRPMASRGPGKMTTRLMAGGAPRSAG